jgi:energy-coupling factor transport system ATP-binding protein
MNSDKFISYRHINDLAVNSLVSIHGSNFSGRTTLLRTFIKHKNLERKLLDSPKTKDLYFGPEISNYLSGIAPTVRGELCLFSGSDINNTANKVLAQKLGLLKLLDNNPGTLSGGEKVCLIMTNILNRKPNRLSIDCSLEQLDTGRRSIVLDWAAHTMKDSSSILIADNRFHEYEIHGLNSQVNKSENNILTKNPTFRKISPEFDMYPISNSPETIAINNLTFGYQRERMILDSVSMLLVPGQIYHLMGCNGAGKSTFAKLLSGVLPTLDGVFRFNNLTMNPWKNPGKKVAYHLQDADDQLQCDDQIPSVAGEIEIGLRAALIEHHEIPKITEAMLKTFGLSDILDEHPFDLPLSIRKRIALAASFAPGKAWIILDEPTLGQDKESSEAIAKIVHHRANFGVGFILITHSEWFHRLLPGPSLKLSDGKILLESQ